MRIHLLLLVLITVALTGCDRSESVSPDGLTGVWVEKSARRDTLIFNPTFQGQVLKGTLTVDRGKEVNGDGYLLPKAGSGIYTYELRGNRIYVRSLFSSLSLGTEYAIIRQGNELQIENFFELGFNQPATATRTLVRLP